jgi:hypothetical protein
MRRRKLVRGMGLLLMLAGAAFVLWPDSPPRDLWADTGRIQFDMSRAEVEAILGPPGDYTTGPTRTTGFIRSTSRPHDPFFERQSHAEWLTDDLKFQVRFDSENRVAAQYWSYSERLQQNPFENRLWRAERQWRKWFP